jgi:hypothetical protein
MTANLIDEPKTKNTVAAAPVADADPRAARARTALVVFLVVCAATVVAFERISARLVADVAVPDAPVGKIRAENVVALPKITKNLPPPRAGASVLLLGNSHTYALPGETKGDPLRPDPGVTLIDELARDVAELRPGRARANFYRLSYPNFLPVEMLVRTEHLLRAGYQPSVAVVGLTWRNIARDARLRHELQALVHDETFAKDLQAALVAPAVSADPPIRATLAAEANSTDYQDSAQTVSGADRIDEAVTEWVGGHVTLTGRSADLRARIYRQIANGIDDALAHKQSAKASYSYDVIEPDLELNLAALRTLFRLLRSRGTQLVLYYAPERDDLPPLADPVRQMRTLESLSEYARTLGAIVIDARRVVPNDLWGWERETPDRSHFREPGHARLARLLAEEVEKRQGWRSLDSDGGGSGGGTQP